MIKIKVDDTPIIPVGITPLQTDAVKIDTTDTLGIKFSNCIIQPVQTVSDYDGPYEVTPSRDTQVLPTSGKVLERNVIVKPIPQNYGLISWNGSTLSVT